MNSRRTFVTLSLSTFAGALLPSSLLAQENRHGGSVFSNANVGAYQQGLLTRARFQTLVGSEFRLYLDNFVSANLTLREVTAQDTAQKQRKTVRKDGTATMTAPAGADLSLSRSPVQPESFVLRFNVSGPAFPQDSYLVDHATLGKFALFVSANADGHCQAVFSRFADQTFMQRQLQATQQRSIHQ